MGTFILSALFLAMINVTELSRNNRRSDIECPGDTITYQCTVQSNSETIQLMWTIIFPGQDPIDMIIFTNDSDRNVVNYYPMNLTARLTLFEIDQNVESELVLTVLQNVSMNGTLLKCSSENLASENATVTVNTSGT